MCMEPQNAHFTKLHRYRIYHKDGRRIYDYWWWSSLRKKWPEIVSDQITKRCKRSTDLSSRIPRPTLTLILLYQFNVEELNGKSIDLSEKGKKDTEIETSSKRKYVLRKDHTSVHSIVRPVIRNDLDGSTGVGPAFAGTFNLSEKIDIKQVSSSDALPVSLQL